MSDTQENRIVDENLVFLAERGLHKWMKYANYQTKTHDFCIKFGFYEEDRTFVNFGTIWDLDQIHPEATVQLTDTEYRYLTGNREYRLFLDWTPKDRFGQKVTYRKRPACYWFYTDRNSKVRPSFLSKFNSKLCNDPFEDPDDFSGWSMLKYPGSFSLVSEYVDSSTTDLFWTCYTYSPKLTNKEVRGILREYNN